MSDKPKLFIFAPREESSESLKAFEEAGLEIERGDPAWQMPHGHYEEAVATQARHATAMMGSSIRHTPITKRIMEGSQRLRIIAKYSVGVDDVDVDAATELGILVTHAPTEANCFGVAESAMAMILALVKKVRERDEAVRSGGWRGPTTNGRFIGARADGHKPLTIGIVGLGRIGTRLSQLLAPWRVRVIACDPYLPPDRFQLANVERVDYETLLRESDVISFHVVLTKETHYMLSDAQFDLVKPGAIVVNTARGKVVDEAALARAIASGKVAATAVDAFETEPLPASSPLLQLDHSKTLFSPHAASFEGDAVREGARWAARSVLTALAGRIPDNVYNKDVIAKWKERFGGVSVLN